MTTLNAGKTINHESKALFMTPIGIPSYQHGRPYMLPEKKLPQSINIRRQQTLTIDMKTNQPRSEEVTNPVTIDQYTWNLNFAIKQMNNAP